MNQHNLPEWNVKSLYGYYNDSHHVQLPINDNKTPRKLVFVRGIVATIIIAILGWLLFK